MWSTASATASMSTLTASTRCLPLPRCFAALHAECVLRFVACIASLQPHMFFLVYTANLHQQALCTGQPVSLTRHGPCAKVSASALPAGGGCGRRSGGGAGVRSQEPLPQGRLQHGPARLGHLPPRVCQGNLQEGMHHLPVCICGWASQGALYVQVLPLTCGKLFLQTVVRCAVATLSVVTLAPLEVTGRAVRQD